MDKYQGSKYDEKVEDKRFEAEVVNLGDQIVHEKAEDSSGGEENIGGLQSGAKVPSGKGVGGRRKPGGKNTETLCKMKQGRK